MNGYEKYMDRQKMSETGLARLMKLETERPPKARKRVPQWVKYAGMAASLFLVVGLFALPILQGAQQQRAAGPNVTDGPAEELQFQEMPRYGFFVDESQYIGKRTPVEPEDTAELFGCAPDDFAGLLETVGLSKYDMEYYTVEAYYPFGVYPKDVAALGDDGYRFVMKGSYTTPREKPENWDETSEISWEMWQGLSSFLPRNDVRLEIYEGHSYLSEADWNEVEPQEFQGHQVAAACDANSDYYAAAAFDVECDGKTYGVLYSAVTYGDCNAKEVVTQMVRYLTQNGLFIEDRGTAQVKTTGLYVMERGESDYPVMPRISFDGESYTFAQSLLSSHLCRGGYEVANGRVTARCDEHHFVFDILDENTLRFVGSESSAPVSYKGEPQITDGAVFRWQATVDGDEARTLDYAELTQPYAYVDFYKALEKNESRELTKDELAKVFPASDGEAGVNYVWTGTAWFKDDGNLRAVVITGEKMDETGTVILTLSTEEELAFVRNQTKKNGKTTYFGKDNTTYGSGMGLVRCFYVNEPGHFYNAPGAYWCYTQCKPASNPLYDYTGYTLYAEVRTSVSEGSLLENEVFNTQWFEAMYKNGLWFQTGIVNGKDIWQLPETEVAAETGVEPSGVFYLEPAEGETLFYPYLNLSGNGNTFSWRRGEESSRSGSYAVADGKVRCHGSGKTYVFEAVDEDTLRYVGAESDTLDYLDGDSITRTLPDGAVLRRNDAQLGALDAKLQLGGKYHMETADGSALADSYFEIERKKPYGDIINKKMTVHFASRDCVCNATDYNAAHDRVTYVCGDCKSVYTFDIVDEDTLRYVASGDKDCIDDCTVFRQLKDGERAVDDVSLRWLWTTPEHDMEVVHHPEPTHHVEVTHHPEPTHHVEEAHHSNSHH